MLSGLDASSGPSDPTHHENRSSTSPANCAMSYTATYSMSPASPTK
jgi:hypothetical protein